MDFSTIPALKPPPGLTSDFVHPVSQVTMTNAIGIITLVLAVFTFAIRLYSNIAVSRSVGYNDYACAVAVGGSMTFFGLTISLKDFAKNQWDIPISAFTSAYFKKMVIQGITGSLALFFAKLSLFLLFLRLFSPNRKLKCGVYLGITFSAAFSLTSVLVTGILCSPRPGQPWDDLRVIFRCSTERYFALIQGVLNMLLDFYILYLPIPVLWKLQLPVRKRMGVIGVFMTGSIACVASVLGLIYKVQLLTSPNLSWTGNELYIFSIVEMNVAIICSSMPAVASFLKLTISKPEYLRSGRSDFVPNREEGDARWRNPNSPKVSSSPGYPVCPDPTLQLKDNGDLELGSVQGKHTWIKTDFENHITSRGSEHQSAYMMNVAKSGGIIKSIGVDLSYQDNPG